MEQEIIYKWVKYRLMWSGKYYLSQSTHNAERAKAKSLHRVIWEDNYWPIPDWYDIHHKDWNTFNNDISNLELVEHSKHLSEHMKERLKDKDIKERNNKHLEEIRDKATEWHRSKEWRERHSGHAKNSILKHLYNHKCKICWKEWESTRKNAEYCSSKCIREWYKNKYTCKDCWKEFMRNKYRKNTDYCKECALKHK